VLETSDEARVRVLTLNRTDALNSFNEALYDATTDALLAAADDPTVAVVVITGAGRAFCAGTDLIEMARRSQRDPTFVAAATASPA
jgi:enoyl-CoA hydratase/carnithine racemase